QSDEVFVPGAGDRKGCGFPSQEEYPVEGDLRESEEMAVDLGESWWALEDGAEPLRRGVARSAIEERVVERDEANELSCRPAAEGRGEPEHGFHAEDDASFGLREPVLAGVLVALGGAVCTTLGQGHRSLLVLCRR